MKYLLLIVLILSSAHSFSEVVNCGSADIRRLAVHGDREGAHDHENKLLIELEKDSLLYRCDGKSYAYLDNTNPAYSGVLSILLAAQAQGKKVEVWINSTVIAGGNAAEIAWVNLYK